jgi:hypothetical protein
VRALHIALSRSSPVPSPSAPSEASDQLKSPSKSDCDPPNQKGFWDRYGSPEPAVLLSSPITEKVSPGFQARSFKSIYVTNPDLCKPHKRKRSPDSDQESSPLTSKSKRQRRRAEHLEETTMITELVSRNLEELRAIRQLLQSTIRDAQAFRCAVGVQPTGKDTPTR